MRQGNIRLFIVLPLLVFMPFFTRFASSSETSVERAFNAPKGFGPLVKKTHWVFTGSKIVDGKFMAQVEQSIAATFHDPFAMLDHPLPTGMDDTLYYVNKEIVPPIGTPVVFKMKIPEKKSGTPD